MNNIFVLLSALLFSFTTLSQNNPQLTPLKLPKGIVSIEVSPNEELWVVAGSGEIFYTPKIGQIWYDIPTWAFYSLRGTDSFKNINFFSEDTIVLSGFFTPCNEQNFVKRSEDRGKSWKKINLGTDHPIGAIYSNQNGKAWMGDNLGRVYHTSDKGKNWAVFDDQLSQLDSVVCSTIHFAKDEKTGLLGSLSGAMYRTTDNCQNWEKLPTPLTQHGSKEHITESNSKIEKVKIFGKQYIVKQGKQVFVSQSDSINWVYLPDVLDFEVAENENLYIVNKNLLIEHYNPELTKTWQTTKPLPTEPRAINIRNNKLFVLTEESIYSISPAEFVEAKMFLEYTLIHPTSEISTVGEESFCFEKQNIFRYEKDKKRWIRCMVLDFEAMRAMSFKNSLIVMDKARNHYKIDYKKQTVSKFQIPNKLFKHKKVVAIKFENSNVGCFHLKKENKHFVKKGKYFRTQSKLNGDVQPSLFLPIDSISTESGQELLKLIDEAINSTVVLADLNITENDIVEFKKQIDEQIKKVEEVEKLRQKSQDGEVIESIHRGPWFVQIPTDLKKLNYYKSIADTLSKIPDKDINNTFWQRALGGSTTSNSKQLTLIFQDGTEMKLTRTIQDNYDHPLTPWELYYAGIKLNINAVKAELKIDQITNGKFLGLGTGPSLKQLALYKIAGHLYKKNK